MEGVKNRHLWAVVKSHVANENEQQTNKRTNNFSNFWVLHFTAQWKISASCFRITVTIAVSGVTEGAES